MKKILIVTIAIASLLSNTNVGFAAAPSPLSSQTEVIVNSSTGNVRNAKVFPLANGSSLVTWQEEVGSTYWLKARTVSATNQLGIIQTINNKEAVSLDQGEGVADAVSSNKAGKIFATWITQGMRYGVQSQKVWGRTSTNGITWSKPFVVVSGLTVSGNAMRCEDLSDFPGCGYTRLQSAIDDKSRMAVLTLDPNDEGKRFRMKATNLSGVWFNYKTLGTFNSTRGSEIVGLTSGFAVSAANYTSGTKCSTKASFFDPKTQLWTTTLTPQAIGVNTVINSHWVQRDSRTLTIALASSSEANGVAIRNFDMLTKKWSSRLIRIQTSEENKTFQDIRAAKVGSSIVLMYNVYDQLAGSNEVRVAKVTGSSPTFTVIGTSPYQIDLLFAGSTAANKPVLAFNFIDEGVRLGGITETTLPTAIPNSATHGYLSEMVKTKADLVQAVGLQWLEGSTNIVLVKGYVN